jgi:hypothetical protein
VSSASSPARYAVQIRARKAARDLLITRQRVFMAAVHVVHLGGFEQRFVRERAVRVERERAFEELSRGLVVLRLAFSRGLPEQLGNVRGGAGRDDRSRQLRVGGLERVGFCRTARRASGWTAGGAAAQNQSQGRKPEKALAAKKRLSSGMFRQGVGLRKYAPLRGAQSAAAKRCRNRAPFA